MKGQLEAREQNKGFAPVASLDDAFEHNTRAGEYLGMSLAINMMNLLKEDLQQMKNDLDIYFSTEDEGGAE